jgi:hypothetical protein
MAILNVATLRRYHELLNETGEALELDEAAAAAGIAA